MEKTKKSWDSCVMLPRVVYLMCVHWWLIVWSVAKSICEGLNIDSNDYDILVPLSKRQTIALMIPENAKPNKFWWRRFEDDKGNEIDVRPDTPFNYLSKCKTKHCWKVYILDYINNRHFSSWYLWA